MKILSYTHQIVVNNYKMGEGYDKKVYDMAISYQYDLNRLLEFVLSAHTVFCNAKKYVPPL